MIDVSLLLLVSALHPDPNPRIIFVQHLELFILTSKCASLRQWHNTIAHYTIILTDTWFTKRFLSFLECRFYHNFPPLVCSWDCVRGSLSQWLVSASVDLTPSHIVTKLTPALSARLPPQCARGPVFRPQSLFLRVLSPSDTRLETRDQRRECSSVGSLVCCWIFCGISIWKAELTAVTVPGHYAPLSQLSYISSDHAPPPRHQTPAHLESDQDC